MTLGLKAPPGLFKDLDLFMKRIYAGAFNLNPGLFVSLRRYTTERVRAAMEEEGPG